MSDNDYFNAETKIPRLSRARSAFINSILDAIAAGFSRLPGREALSQNKVTYVVAGGSATQMTAQMTPTLVTYQSGLNVKLKVTASNTGPVTLNVDDVGEIAVKLVDGSDPQPDELSAGDVVNLIYNGSDFILHSPSRSHLVGVANTLGADLVFSGNPLFSGSPDFSQAENIEAIRSDLSVPSVAEMGAGLGNVDAVTLGGQAPAFYRDAANLDAGRVPTDRLSGVYPISVTFADGAQNCNTLNGYVAGQMANGVSRKVSGTQVTSVAFWNHAPIGHVITGFWRHPSSGLIDIFFTHAIQIQLHNGVWVTMAG